MNRFFILDFNVIIQFEINFLFVSHFVHLQLNIFCTMNESYWKTSPDRYRCLLYANYSRRRNKINISKMQSRCFARIVSACCRQSFLHRISRTVNKRFTVGLIARDYCDCGRIKGRASATSATHLTNHSIFMIVFLSQIERLKLILCNKKGKETSVTQPPIVRRPFHQINYLSRETCD